MDQIEPSEQPKRLGQSLQNRGTVRAPQKVWQQLRPDLLKPRPERNDGQVRRTSKIQGEPRALVWPTSQECLYGLSNVLVDSGVQLLPRGLQGIRSDETDAGLCEAALNFHTYVLKILKVNNFKAKE